jgi:hypothetical protein
MHIPGGFLSPEVATVTLWGNDLFAEFAPACNSDFLCIKSRAAKGLAAFAARLDTIVAQLRAAAPNSDIILSGAWNFDVEHLVQADPLFRSIDGAIRKVAPARNARVAKMYPVFDPAGGVARQKARICALTLSCSKGDPHATDAGFRAMANAFFAASGYPWWEGVAKCALDSSVKYLARDLGAEGPSA